MAKYVKLGEKAASFSDAFTGLNLAPGEIKEISVKEANSGRTKNALRGGHLVPVSEGDYKAYLKSLEPEEEETEKPKKGSKGKGKKETEETLEDKLNAMTDEQLIDYYQETYDVTHEQTEAFADLTTEKKVKEILALEQ